MSKDLEEPLIQATELIKNGDIRGIKMIQENNISAFHFLDTVKHYDVGKPVETAIFGLVAKDIEKTKGLQEFFSTRALGDDKTLSGVLGILMNKGNINLPSRDVSESRQRNAGTGDELLWTRGTLLASKLLWNSNKYLEKTLTSYIDAMEKPEAEAFASSEDFRSSLLNLSLQGIYDTDLVIKMASKFNFSAEESALMIMSSSSIGADGVNYLFKNLDWNKKVNVQGINESPTISLNELHVINTLRDKHGTPEQFSTAIKRMFPYSEYSKRESGKIFLNGNVIGEAKKGKISINIHGIVDNLSKSGEWSDLYQIAKREAIIQKCDFMECPPVIKSELGNNDNMDSELSIKIQKGL